MVCYKWCICTFVALLSAISSTTAKKHHANQIVSDTIVVDPSGKGDFRTIQAAINSIPSNNKRWTCISIKKGLYRCVLAVSFLVHVYIYLEFHRLYMSIVTGKKWRFLETGRTSTWKEKERETRCFSGMLMAPLIPLLPSLL